MHSREHFWRGASGLLVVAILVVIVKDSQFRFDADLVKLKHQNYSAQRHWSWRLGQLPVYRDSSLKYEGDFRQLRSLVGRDSFLLSDIATSYFVSSYLPVFVPNVHRHQGRWMHHEIINFLEKRTICYMEFAENKSKVADFFAKNKTLDYILINKDRTNTNRKRDCLAFRSHTLIEHLPSFASLVFEGEYLNLYELR